ncbi:MAG TPA: hypothetical protein VI365_01370 [Trebonia sp.]
MEDVHADETREARRLLASALETVPDDPTAADGLLRAVRRRHARRRRSRALLLTGAAAAAAGTAAVALLSVTVAAAPPALAAVTGALSRAGSESFRMNLTVTIAPAQPLLPSPLRITGELDLKRHLGQETISNGWRTLIVGGNAYTKILPSQTSQFGTGGKLWTETPLPAVEDELPYKSPGGRLAWDFNSNRPFNPQAVLALLNSNAKLLDDEGPVSGPGWTGTRYTFTVSHPQDTGGLVDSITCTMDVDRQGHIRHLAQTTVFGTTGKPTYMADFIFSDFGIRFSVTPPPASQTNRGIGVGALQF